MNRSGRMVDGRRNFDPGRHIHSRYKHWFPIHGSVIQDFTLRFWLRTQHVPVFTDPIMDDFIKARIDLSRKRLRMHKRAKRLK
ncbi:hypothetical protein TNCV_5097651 [Trichonephila clavipes]|nr:hypothetical protein TNCV_5097651 [Trichonephila clavipes]